MGVIDFGTGSYLVKFDDAYSKGLFAIQGDSARQFHFIITDLNNQAIDTSNLELKMNLFVKNRKAGVATSVRQGDGSFIMTIPQGLVLEHDENAKYQLFITDGVEILSQKSGVFRIEQNILFDNNGGVNLLFDFLEFKRALDQQEVFLTQMSDSVDLAITTKNQVTILESSANSSKDECQRIELGLANVLTSETNRIGEEDIRNSNETARISDENTRKTNETNRVGEEDIRNSNETIRISNENSRMSNENARNSNEGVRNTNETTRNTAENSRATTFANWVTSFQTFVQNDSNHSTNESSRNTQWANIKSELQTLMGQLENIDVGSLQLQLNTISNNLLGYVNKMQVNANNNTIEVFKGNDTDSPSIVLNLPQGFSGNYNDLSNKPNIYVKSEIDTKISLLNTDISNKVSKSGSKVLSDNNYDDIAKGKVDNIPANPKYTDTIVDISGKFDKIGGPFEGQVKAQSNTDYSIGQVRNIASGTALPSTSGFGNGDIFIVRSS